MIVPSKSWRERFAVVSFGGPAFATLYASYLDSPEWAVRRDRVLERDAHRCQGCLGAAAEHVHHLSYAHVGAELLFELVALCERCHEAAHDDRRGKQSAYLGRARTADAAVRIGAIGSMGPNRGLAL